MTEEYLIHAGEFFAGFREAELAAMAAALGVLSGARRVFLRRERANGSISAETQVTPALRKQARELRKAARSFLRELES